MEDCRVETRCELSEVALNVARVSMPLLTQSIAAAFAGRNAHVLARSS